MWFLCWISPKIHFPRNKPKEYKSGKSTKIVIFQSVQQLKKLTGYFTSVPNEFMCIRSLTLVINALRFKSHYNKNPKLYIFTIHREKTPFKIDIINKFVFWFVLLVPTNSKVPIKIWDESDQKCAISDGH